MDKSSGDSDSQVGAAAAVSSMQVEDDDEEQPKEAADDSRADVYINPPAEEVGAAACSLCWRQTPRVKWCFLQRILTSDY